MMGVWLFGGKYQNPYESNSDEYNFHERGWSQMQKRPSAEIADQLYKKLGIRPNEKNLKNKKYYD
jgi:hypothetical protein